MNKEFIELEVDGMTCTNCAMAVQKVLEKAGGEEINVNFATKEVRFVNAASIRFEDIKKGIEGLGYQVSLPRAGKNSGKRAWTPLEKKLVFSALFTLPLLFHMVLPVNTLFHNPLFQLILTLPVMYIGITYFGKSAFNSLRSGIANMDVLIFIGSFSAFVYSVWGTAMNWGHHSMHNYLFFETAATIITLVLLGNYFEERSVEKTTHALKDLVELGQKQARMIRIKSDGTEEIEEVAPDTLILGDQILCNTGDQIMADGIIVKGDAELDESLITGESNPVFKQENEAVISGSVVLGGSIVVKVKKGGKQSTLQKIIALVKDAQGKKPGIQKMGDQVSAVFVPVVVGISLLTFVLSYFVFDIRSNEALMAAIAVLVISCPCAMGLATPTAVMVGVGKGARQGILVKGGESVEKLAKIKTVVFDKTGTLTNGKFRVKNFETYQFDDTVAKNIVLHMEKASSHPIAQSIVKNHADWFMMKFQYGELKEIKGKGLYAKDASGNEFLLGKKDFVSPEKEVPFEKDIYLSYCDKVIAGFDVEDEVKPGAREAIADLQKQGIRTVLLSGDNERKCRYVAERTGITEIYSGQLPEDKLKKISEWNAQAPTAMVGDGINDAPALSLAYLGISLGQATDIAQQSAEVILMGGQIKKVSEAIALGKATYRTIKQNLFWALAYNVVAIPVAALGYLSPMVGALSMAFSDVIVIGNSLRLKWKK